MVMHCLFLLLGLLASRVPRIEACGIWEDESFIDFAQPIMSHTDGPISVFTLKGNPYTVVDVGAIYSGNRTSASFPISDLSTGEYIISSLYKVSYDSASVVTETVDRGTALSSDGTALNDNACIIETIETRLARYGYPNITVDAASVTTWNLVVGAHDTHVQAVIALGSNGGTFVLLQYQTNGTSLDSLLPAITGFIFMQGVSGLLYGYTCRESSVDSMRLYSNSYCGFRGLWVFNLDALCTNGDICVNLEPNPLDRNPNCRELIVPNDECNVGGFCQFVDNSTDSFTFDFAFYKNISHFAGFEILNRTDESGDSMCVLNATDEGNYYHVMQVVDSAFVQTCGVNVSGENMHTFTVYQYEIGANEFLQRDSKIYRISCNPTNLPSAITYERFAVEDIVQESRPNTTDNGFQLLFGNQLKLNDLDYEPYAPMANVNLGEYLFLSAWFSPDPNFEVNAYPYGLYAKQCWISAMPHLDTDSKVKVIDNGCVVDTLFSRSSTSFKSAITGGYQPGEIFVIAAGPIRAARWRKYNSIYAICEVGVCHTYPYQDSFCNDSCYGKGVNIDGDLPNQGPMNKRQASDGQQRVLLTAGLTIIDTDDSENDVDEALISQSCANKTMAYITISVMVIMLFIATIITSLLFLQLQSRKRK